MPHKTRKHLLDRFQQHLLEAYKNHCRTHELKATNKGLVIFLIDQDLIGEPAIRRFTVLKEMEGLNNEKVVGKTLAVHTIARRFNISERAVWNILQRQMKPD